MMVKFNRLDNYLLRYKEMSFCHGCTKMLKAITTAILSNN